MSQTSTVIQQPLLNFTFDQGAWEDTYLDLQKDIALAILPWALYGIFVLLCGASLYVLVQNRRRNQSRPPTLILALALAALFSSTTLYSIATVLLEAENIYNEFIMNFPWDATNSTGEILSGPWPALLDSDSMMQFQYCAPTAALTINILLGDAIVCWRACVLWTYNRIVLAASVMLLLATFALGVVDSKYSCLNLGNVYVDGSTPSGWTPDSHADGTGGMYQGFSYGVAATVLSLSTNLFATVAVAVKAWQSRRVLKRYMVTGPMGSQMAKVLSLLVESGALYCGLWVVVLAWQSGNYQNPALAAFETHSFWDIVNVIINGALVPLIAIYPTVIIVLVALNRSHFEAGFADPSPSTTYSLPLRRLAVAVNTTTTAQCDSPTRDDSERVLEIGRDDVYGEEASSTNFTEVRKLGDMV